MSVGDGSGLSSSCWCRDVVHQLFSREHELLVHVDMVPRTNIHQHTFICTNTSRRHTTNRFVCLSHTLLPYTSWNAVVTSVQDRNAIERACVESAGVENGHISSCQRQ